MKEALQALCVRLQRVHGFYDSIGGLPGYQLRCMEMLLASAHASAKEEADSRQPQQHGGANAKENANPQQQQQQQGQSACEQKAAAAARDPDTRFLMPRGLNIAGAKNRAAATAAAAAGLEALPRMGEILPLGGAPLCPFASVHCAWPLRMLFFCYIIISRTHKAYLARQPLPDRIMQLVY